MRGMFRLARAAVGVVTRVDAQHADRVDFSTGVLCLGVRKIGLRGEPWVSEARVSRAGRVPPGLFLLAACD